MPDTFLHDGQPDNSVVATNGSENYGPRNIGHKQYTEGAAPAENLPVALGSHLGPKNSDPQVASAPQVGTSGCRSGSSSSTANENLCHVHASSSSTLSVPKPPHPPSRSVAHRGRDVYWGFAEQI